MMLHMMELPTRVSQKLVEHHHWSDIKHTNYDIPMGHLNIRKSQGF